jgi:CarD family transcriptional regulator
MYSVGDKVVHPGYGPGIVKLIERRQVIGEAKRYYVIEMQTGGGTLMTPVAGADTVGLRPAVSTAVIKRLFKVLAEPPQVLASDFRERQEAVEERLKESDVFVVAEVIRDLTWHEASHGLTKRDGQLKQRAEDLLASEIALVKEIDQQEALEDIQATVGEAIRQATANGEA